MAILPYIEQGQLRKMYQGYGQPDPAPHYDDPVNVQGTTGTQLPLLLCPSDLGPNTQGWPANPGHCTYHNYVANYGNTSIADQTVAWQTSSYNGLTFQGAPFSATPIKLTQIIDGTSTTMMVSEVIIGQRHDLRGDTWYATGAGFETSLRPNDSAPDLTWGDNTWCDPNPPNPPCAAPSNGFVYGARSRHRGGVNVVFCDGHWQFITDDIATTLWQDLSTSQGGEVIGAF